MDAEKKLCSSAHHGGCEFQNLTPGPSVLPISARASPFGAGDGCSDSVAPPVDLPPLRPEAAAWGQRTIDLFYAARSW